MRPTLLSTQRRTQSPTVVRLFGLAALASALSCVPDQQTSSFNFETHAFSFPNFDSEPSGAQMSVALAERMFGSPSVCTTGEGASCVPNQAAAAWIDEVNVTLRYGHSEGMAVLAQLMALGKVDPTQFGGPTPSALSFDRPDLRAEITYWAATQKLPAVHRNDKKFMAKDVLPFLAEALASKTEAWRLLLAIRTENGFRAGHGVVPIAYYRGTQDGVYWLRIYDPNFPNEERSIELNVKQNTWRYDGSLRATDPRVYSGDSANQNLLHFSPVSLRTGTFSAPFNDARAFVASGDQVSVLVEGMGASVGFKDGKVVENGGTVLPGASACACKLTGEIINVSIPDAGTGARTITVKPSPIATAATANITGNGVSVSAGQVGGESTFSVSESGKDVKVTGETKTLTVTVKNADGSTTTVSATVDKSVNSIQIDASDPNRIVIGTDASTNGTTVTVTVTKTEPGGATKQTTTTGTTTNQDVQLTVNATTGAATVNTNVNLAVCRNGVKDSMEGDVDCGQFCSLQREKDETYRGFCGENRTCRQEADCYATGFLSCVQGVCRLASCSDGLKNGEESDVDCGSRFPQSCPCPLNRPCLSDRNCRDDLFCIGGLCRAQGQHVLTVQGLDALDRVSFIVVRDGTRVDHVVSGVAGQAQVTTQFAAVNTLSISIPSDANLDLACTFAGGARQWSWSRLDAGLATAAVVTCTRTRFDLLYVTDGGCRYSNTLSDGGRETFTATPSLRVSLGSDAPYEAPLYLASTPRLVRSVRSAPDGGLPWRLEPLAGVEAWATGADYRNTNRYRFECSGAVAGGAPAGGGREVVASIGCSCTHLETYSPPVLPADAGPVGDTCLNPHEATFTRLATGERMFYVPASLQTMSNDYGDSATCLGAAGRDAVYRVVVPAGQRLGLRLESNTLSSWNPSMSLVEGPATNCALQPRVCRASANSEPKGTDETLTYDNVTTRDQEVFVVVDTANMLSGSVFYEFARLRGTLESSPLVPVDAGVDAGTDAGVDAGFDAGAVVDAGTDAGFDAGSTVDAGTDAGGFDAGVDAGPGSCSVDSDCASLNCFCGLSSGACAGAGTCGPAPRVVSTATNGTAPSGSYSTPATCVQVAVSAWGASGGGGRGAGFPMGLPTMGGAGGLVRGVASIDGGTVIGIWIGGGGAPSQMVMGDEGFGSYLGTAANGGAGDTLTGMGSGGGGGGLTSVQAGALSFAVPAGGGGGSSLPGSAAGDSNSGMGSGREGGAADGFSEAGGGGAGDPGGLGGTTTGARGGGGAFGTLPMGFTSFTGTLGTPSGTSLPDYAKCPVNTATSLAMGGPGHNGCVVVRCAP